MGHQIMTHWIFTLMMKGLEFPSEPLYFKQNAYYLLKHKATYAYQPVCLSSVSKTDRSWQKSQEQVKSKTVKSMTLHHPGISQDC